MILTLMAVLMIGCGEEEATESSAANMLGTMKIPEAVAAAPQAPHLGFRVKEVGYYTDWRLTKPLSGTVKPGTTIFTKVVFSEPVQFKPADDNSDRPILYYRIDKKRFRYRITKHGASGEDFVSGDAKPRGGGTDDYICKFTSPEDATDRFRAEIGRLNANKDGVTLPAFYTHKEQLQIGLPETPPKVEDPDPAIEPLMITSITHYRDDSDEPIPEDGSVEANTTIITDIVFSMPVRANSIVISYPAKSGTKRLYHTTGVHWRGSYQISANGTTVRSKLVASEETFSLTIERAASLEGNVLKQAVTAPELSVVPGMRSVVPVPPEPAVSKPQEPAVVKPALPEPQERTTIKPTVMRSGGFTNAAIEEYRALHAMVHRVREMRKNTQDPHLRAHRDLLWHFVTGVTITAHERVQLDVIYRNQRPGATEDQRIKTGTARRMEYLRIKLAHPDSTAEETLEIYTASVKDVS